MRTAYKVWSAIAAGVFVVVAVTDMSKSTTTKSVAATVQASPTAVSAPAAPTTSGAPVLRVTRVIDGDTVEVSTGRTVQILGIDACEPGTYGGEQALANARSQLEGEVVTLRAEPGVTTDRHGYDLRYLAMEHGGDFAEFAVVSDHTVAYPGNGAAPSYVAGLKARDDGPQRCAAPAPEPEPVPSTGDGGSIDWPSPGDQGLPDGALTGGYCAKKWWC